MRIALSREIDRIRRMHCPDLAAPTGSKIADLRTLWDIHQAEELEGRLIINRERLLMETP